MDKETTTSVTIDRKTFARLDRLAKSNKVSKKDFLSCFEVFRSLNSKADHLVNWDLISSIHGDMDANQVLFLNHLVSDLRFQLKNKDKNIIL